MNRTCIHSLLFLPFLGGLLCSALSAAHAQNEIVQNPEAVLLRNVWMVQGSPGDRVGSVLGSLGDINGDSIGDFIWGRGNSPMWYVQYGGEQISDTPVQSLYVKTTTTYPIVGDFWGTGEKQVGFASYYTDSNLRFHMYLLIYGITGDTIRTEPVAIGDPAQGIWPGISGTPEQYFAIDLDRDGDDEVVIVQNVVRRNDDVRDAQAEVWIYEGGPNFQLDTPSVVLKDTEEQNNTYYATVGDIDGDRYPDLITGGIYRTDPKNRLSIWWGNADILSLSKAPDKVIDLEQTALTLPPTMPVFLDLDGDTTLDMVGNRLIDVPSDRWEISYFSSKAASARTRSFDSEDAQQQFRTISLFAEGSLGYINDSLRRFEMLALFGPGKSGGVGLYGLSGGRGGLNETYDASYSAAEDGLGSGNIFGPSAIVENCTGKGWDCYLTGNASWGSNNQGIVVLLEGGSYIPTDDTTSGVETIATQDHAEAFHTWPNPVIDELHIAWRGDLRSPPSLMVVYDINGREITSGAVEAWRGEAVWRCGSVSAGTYLLAIYDETGELLATTRVVKQ